MTDHKANPERRLAAIMATDVVGYSRLMQSDEAGALAALAVIRDAAQSHIKKHRGRIANTAGDSVLAEFGSAVEAVSCAMALQQQLSSHQGDDLQVRIGIHLGDVVDKGGDLFGTAVNVAARLEGIAQPGGIVVSAAVRDAIAGKLAASFTDLGPQTLKNIEGPLRAYALSPKAGAASPDAYRLGEALPLPVKPSIAVLPFDNLSGDREQEYFADGMVEEIITALSRFRQLFVIARNSSFAYKGRAVDVKQVGKELGVRYILEGSVRKAGNRLRISGQLIDTASGAHLWADRFDGGSEDIFELQDQVTSDVVGAIAPKIEQAEIERARRKPTENLDAYDHYLRGLVGVHQWSKEGNQEALSHFYRAIEIDPNFASAYGMAARCYAQRKSCSWASEPEKEAVEAARLARKATDLGRDDAVALYTAAVTWAYVVGRLDEGIDCIERALALNPNLAWAWVTGGWMYVWLGRPEEAIQRINRALRLSPNDTQIFNMHTAMANAHFFAGRYEEASSWAEMALREKPDFTLAAYVAAATNALAGRLAEAEKAMALVRQQNPTFRVSNLRNLYPFRRPEDFAKMAEGLRLAGLPE